MYYFAQVRNFPFISRRDRKFEITAFENKIIFKEIKGFALELSLKIMLLFQLSYKAD